MRNGASAMAMLARPVVGATKANAASKHKMWSSIKLNHYFVMSFTAGVMPSCWWLDNESGQRKAQQEQS